MPGALCKPSFPLLPCPIPGSPWATFRRSKIVPTLQNFINIESYGISFVEWFTQQNDVGIIHLLHVSIVYSFLLQSNIPLYGYTSICLSMNLAVTFPQQLKNVFTVKNNTHSEKHIKPHYIKTDTYITTTQVKK